MQVCDKSFYCWYLVKLFKIFSQIIQAEDKLLLLDVIKGVITLQVYWQ